MEITGYKKNVKCKDVDDVWLLVIRMYAMLNKIQISISEEKILSYFCQFGINKETERKILKDYVVSKQGILSNLKTSLVKKKLVKKTASNTYKVADDLEFKIEDTYFLMLKLHTDVSS